MKTRSRLAIAVLALVLLATVVPVVAQERVDLIVLLDSSRSMFQYYNQVIDFVVSDAIREYLRFGDGFHLMNFADTTQLEVAQVLRTEEDVRTVLSRLYLMYPLGRNTDLITALRGVYQYGSGLGTSSSKYIILITDGMHSPASDSLYASLTADQVKTEMERNATRIRERGWTMRIIQVPFNGKLPANFEGAETQTTGTISIENEDATSGTGQTDKPSSRAIDSSLSSTGTEDEETLSDAPGTGDYIADIAAVLGTSIATFDPDDAESTIAGIVDILRISYPEKTTIRTRTFKMRLELENPSTRQIPIELEGLVLPDGNNILVSKEIAVLAPGQSIQVECSVSLPESFPEGSSSLVIEPRLANDVRVSPAKGTIDVELRIPALAILFRNSASLFLFMIVLIATLTVLFLITRYIRAVHRRAEEPVLQSFLGSSETREENTTNTRPVTGRQAVNARYQGSEKVLVPVSMPLQAEPLQSVSSRSLQAEPLLVAPLPSSASVPVNRNQALLGSASHNQAGEDRSKLLDQWSPGDRARYVLPLKATILKEGSTRPGNPEPYVYQARVTKPGTLRVQLRVRNQNPFIGDRNIKTLHAGRRKSIGGKSSDFMVFLLPVPKRIADIHYDGQAITIVPIKPAFFPDYQGPIEAKLGDDIRIVNYRGKEMFMRFEHYIPPLEKLNRLLHCIEMPGITYSMDENLQA